MQHQNILSILLYGFGLILALAPYRLYKQVSQRIIYGNVLSISAQLAWQQPLSNDKQGREKAVASAISTYRQSD